MDSKVYFSERQKFGQLWLWLILIGMVGLTVWVAYRQLIVGESVGNNPMSDTGLKFFIGLSILLVLLFLLFRLDTEIRSDGVWVRFFPFSLKMKCYPWSEITKAYVRTYSPIKEYGGWGIRFGSGDKGKALNVSGNRGLQLEFANRKKLLIGTNKPEEVQAVLEKLGRHQS